MPRIACVQLLLASLVLKSALLGAPPRLKLAVTASPERARPGEQVELRLDMEVEGGWHIYAPSFTGTGKPTALKLESGPLKPEGKLRFPEPRYRREEVLEEDVLYHEGKFRYTQLLRVAPDAPPGKARISGKLSYQTCSEKTCDLPAEAPVSAEVEVLPPEGAPAAAEKGQGKAGEALPTFTVSIDPPRIPQGGRGEVLARYKVPEGFYIYAPDDKAGSPTRLIPDETLAKPDGEARANPPPEDKEQLGEKYRILEGKGEIRQPVVLSRDAPPGKLVLPVTVDYMICDANLCVPGQFKAEAAVEVVKGESQGWLALILLAITSGLFALLMPCTYPMIPLTISYFTKQAEVRHARVLPLALAYGGGIVAVFIVIGLVVGGPIIAFSQHWATNAVFAFLFVLFGLSMLGVFEIRLPASLNALAARARGTQGYLGVFFLGATLVITSFTCSAPLIGVMFAGGAQARSFSEIVVGMGIFGLIMALPFVVLALFPGRARSLPRSGEWMQTLKVTLGFVELAAALKFISNVDVVFDWRILPLELFLYLVAAIAFTTALYLYGAIRLRGDPAEIGPLRLMFGMVFLVFTVYFVYCTRLPTLNVVMAAFAPPYRAQALAKEGPGNRPEPTVAWSLVEDDLEAGLDRARKEKKLALLNWTGIT